MAHPMPAVFVVDDDAAVRDSLTLLLHLRGYSSVCFPDGSDFLAAVDTTARGCILLDLRMPGIGGLEVIAGLAARSIDIPVIILTAHGDVATTRAALQAGAFDFLEKPIDEGPLLKTVAAAIARDAEIQVQKDRRAAIHRQISRLTPRERQVLKLVVDGHHNREVARELGISPRTVEVYKARVMDKLQVDRLADLIRLALDLGSTMEERA